MPSALASQLASSASLNAPLLSETARKKHFAESSYLFSASTKGQIDDLDTIHALSLNALSQLKQIYPSFTAFDEQSLVYRTIFSYRAKETDRTLLTKDELTGLNAALKNCLAALGPCLMESAAGRVIEWLVQRFRVNEFNVPDVLSLFFPYHESPHFAKMVSILTISGNMPWRFLAGYKATGKPVQRNALVTEMLRDRELARFIVSLLPDSLTSEGGKSTHRTLICFNTSIILEYITRAERRDLDTPILAFLLPSLTEPLKTVELDLPDNLRKDSILGSFVLLAALSQKRTFTMPAVKAIMSGMVHCAAATSLIGAYQLLTALISFLGPQKDLEDVSVNVADEMISLPDFLDALKSSLEWTGVEKLVLPIVWRLVENKSDENCAAVLQSLITSKRTPKSILLDLSKKLLLKGEGDELLSEVYQRYSGVVRSAVEDLASEDVGKKAQLERTLMCLASAGSTGKVSQDVVLGSSNAEASVRTSSVKHIVQLLADNPEGMDNNEQSALKDSLLSRIYDTEVGVLDALYSEPAVLIPIMTDCPDLLSKLANTLTEQKVSRSVLRTHLSFFCNAFVSARPEQSTRVALALVLPNALFSKPRHKTATAVWEVVSKSHLGQEEFFKGTKEIIETGSENITEMNNALSKRLAENFRVSNHYPEFLAWLLENALNANEAHTRLFALLVLRALLDSLSGENRIDASLKFMNMINASNLSSLEKLGEEQDPLEEETVLKNIVSKPSSRTTTQRLQFMNLMSIAATPRPQNRQLIWFSSQRNLGDNETIGMHYIYLQRMCYSTINAIATNIDLSIRANHAIFEAFGSDSLLFLASVWTSPVMVGGVDQDVTRYVALRHASAFLRGQNAERPVDFQVVLPSLLTALQASDKRVRAAAMECITHMAASNSGSKPTCVYAFDQVYGSDSARLQYLDWSDEAKYLNSLVECRDHLMNDADFLVLFHHEHLSRSKVEKRKDVKYRQHLLCFLLSHVISCPSTAIKMSILKSISRVSHMIKLQMLLPTIERALDSLPHSDAEKEVEIYTLQTFDSSTAKEANADGSNAWSILMRAIEHYLLGGRLADQWKQLRSTIQDSLFNVLSAKRQLELALRLITLGGQVGEEAGVKHILSTCVKTPTLMIALLQSLQPDVKTSSERVSKRAKTDNLSPDSESAWLSRLSFLAEVLASQKLPGSTELISALLDTLSRIVSSSVPLTSDVIYVEQLLMTCLESAVSQIQGLPTLSPSTIRTDVLVELIRTSENPQTFNQALLLLASLANLSPESVLHNVMPIFTFMGSNVFHRDDSYSFKVIQKTTESIVPVATASLKDKYDDVLDLYVASRELLRTFTDASTHIPRHRRTSFFTHLVDVLHAEDYLAPVLMLLSDKSANRVSRQERQEAQTTLALPLSVLQHYASTSQLLAMKEIVKEIQRLSRLIDDPKSQSNVFLEDATLEEHAVSPATLRKRQCQTLLIFIGFGMKQLSQASLAKMPSDDLQFIVTSLIEFATFDSTEQTNEDLREVGSTAQWSLLQSMTVISAQFFVSTILSMLSSENGQIYQAAFSLLASRIPEMKAETREGVSSDVAQIVKRMSELIPHLQGMDTILEAMKALSSISETSSPEEESPLTVMITVVIDIVRRYPGISQAIAVIPVLARRLGPRVIPSLRSLIYTCVSVVKSSDKLLSHESLVGSLHALSSLMKTIPKFWSAQEIKLVIDLYLDEELATSKDLSSQFERLVKLMAKQLPSKVVLSSLLQCWPLTEELRREKGGLSSFGRFFDLVKRCLHFAVRSDVVEHLRALFSHFLQSFEARGVLQSSEASTGLEDKIISAYLELVVKLNETMFQSLFRRMVDWAFGDEAVTEKQITFCRYYSASLDLFRELMTPYMSLLINHFAELLRSFQKEENINRDLWLASIETLSKSFVADDGVYWRDDRIRIISDLLVQQIPVCINLKITATSGGRTLLSDCLSALIDCLEDEASVKAVNLAILKHTRNEDARSRVFALQCSAAIWQAHGAKLRAFGNETATFIIECAEDENEEVVRICRQLKDAVQAEVGKIEGL